MGDTEEEEIELKDSDDEEIEEEDEPDCVHQWEEGMCVKCLDVWEPDDFSGATEGDR